MKPSQPKLLLHLEALAVLVGALLVYQRLEASWGLFAILFLAPDLSMLGYLGGNAIGARVYNLAHTYLLPLCIAAFGYSFHRPLLVDIGVIWIAHIGFDRLLGYGLKYPTAFKETHLGRV